MKLIVNQTLLRKWHEELTRAAENEIGGMLFAEHLGEQDFRLRDFSVQHSGGDVACFIRDPALHTEHIARFHDETHHDYQRFNYLGEWHSHPLFDVRPSRRDMRQMSKIANEAHGGILQAALLIVRLEGKRLEVGGLAFQKYQIPCPIELVLEDVTPETDTILPTQKPSETTGTSA